MIQAPGHPGIINGEKMFYNPGTRSRSSRPKFQIRQRTDTLEKNETHLPQLIDTSRESLMNAKNGTAHFKKCRQLFEYQHLL
jgi:hypothetical protein